MHGIRRALEAVGAAGAVRAVRAAGAVRAVHVVRVVLPLGALSVFAVFALTACGTMGPDAGAAYGTGPSASSSSSSSSSSASTSVTNGGPMIPAKALLTVKKTSIGYVLATSSGRTVYWYAKDAKGSGKSSCSGGCLSAWPAVEGTPNVPSGVKLAGKLGTISRSGGVTQVTYDGYPLYTYAGDTAAGQVSGNGSGGVWHVFSGGQVSASPAAAAAASGSGTSGTSVASPSASASGMGY